jgi:long-chain acyl-CoA synthetase
MFNLANILDYSAKEYAEKTALVFGNQRLTYGELNAMANLVANGLASKGIGKGDKVVLSCPNLPYFPIVYFGILKAGATAVPINVLLKSREIAYLLKDSDAAAYFCFQGTPDLPMAQEGWSGFQEAPDCKHFWIITPETTSPSPITGAQSLGQLMGGQTSSFDTIVTQFDDTAVILYTSGTTGFPKGAELSHGNMTMNLLGARDLAHMKNDDVLLVVLPLFHSFGQTVLMNAGFAVGGTLVLIPNFTPDSVLQAMQTEKVTIFAGVPTMYWALLAYENKDGGIDISQIADNLRVGISGAASLPVEFIKGFEEKYKIPIMEGYGLSETCPVATFNHLNKERKPGSVGTPIWGVEIAVMDNDANPLAPGEVGEVAVRGHNVMKGYYQKPDATAEAFKGTTWFHTGDLGRLDEDGYLYIVDRVKDMIIRGGYNVYPREIEEILMTHPAVSIAAVIGVPSEPYGEEIMAFIIPKEGETPSADDIIAWAKQNMAAYKYPRKVEIRNELPISATGKVLKRDLRIEL